MTKAQQYLQRAGKDIQRAVQALEFDLKQFQKAVENREVALKREIQDIKSSINREKADLASDNGALDQLEAVKGIRDDKKEIKTKEQEFEDFKNQHQDQAEAHKQAIVELEQFNKTIIDFIPEVSKDLPG